MPDLKPRQFERLVDGLKHARDDAVTGIEYSHLNDLLGYIYSESETVSRE